MAQFLTLYLDLEDGNNADLERVALASLHWAALIKEAAYLIAPDAQIRIELVSGTEGSLSLNSIVKVFKGQKALSRAQARTIAFAVVGYFALETVGYGYSKLLDTIFESENTSDQEISEILEKIDALKKDKEARKRVEEVFRTLDDDPSVSGIGVGARPAEKPAFIVPKKDFSQIYHRSTIIQEESKKRRRVSRETLNLVSPILVEGDRKWRFSFHEGQFSAQIKDADFLTAVLSGTSGLEMMAGIQLDVELERREEFDGKVWVIKESIIRKVFSVKSPMRQTFLFGG
jgi:hypothetical protein